jgi:hypothetical protein
MRKLLVVAVGVLGLMAAPALANTLEAFFANTVETTAAGATTKWRFNSDGTLSATLPDGANVTGTWVQKNGQFCVTVGQAPESCSPISDGKKVGDTWEATNAAGQTFSVTIKAGR